METTSLWYKFSNSNIGFVPRNWYGTDRRRYTQTDRQTEGLTERQRDRETERQRHELKRSWLLGVPPKGLEARALTFGGTDGSMLGRRGWFDALSKGMV